MAKKEITYSTLENDVAEIKKLNSNIKGQELLQELGKKGWKLHQYRQLFFNFQDCLNYLGIGL